MSHSLLPYLNPVFLWPYKLLLAATGSSAASFWLGTLWVCLVCTVVGELTMFGAYWLNRDHFKRLRAEMILHNNMSIRAISWQDKESYKACNTIANDAFGLNFFSGIALFAASVWPAFFAMGWLSAVFGDTPIPVPLTPFSLGYAAIFVPMYILTRVGFSYLVKPRVWPFSRMLAFVTANEDCGEGLMSWGALMQKPAGPSSSADTADKPADPNGSGNAANAR